MTAHRQNAQNRKPDIIHRQMARIVPSPARWLPKSPRPRPKVFHHARGSRPRNLSENRQTVPTALGVHHRQLQTRAGKLYPPRLSRRAATAYTHNALPEQHDGPDKTPRDESCSAHLAAGFRARVNLAIDFLKSCSTAACPVPVSVAGIGERKDNPQSAGGTFGAGRQSYLSLGGVRDLSAYFEEVDILLNTPSLSGDHGAGSAKTSGSRPVAKPPS